ncbi:hypothetical protein F183_A13810 [Bryobacterales bacterium F-183]|nr:hypothetical protein F183_A13810 [Bryobacterales bacterium F-183]
MTRNWIAGKSRWILTLLLAAFALPMAAQDTSATVFLVRHAERSGPAKEDPITAAGQERAQLLARMFGEAGISKVIASEYRRTQESAAPLAKRLGVTVTVIAAGDTKALGQAFAAMPDGSAAVAVRHSGEIENLLEQLGAASKIAKIEETEYDRLLILTFRSGKLAGFRTLRYGAAWKQ